MSIMWKYLDKRQATIAAIKDYKNMSFILKSTDAEIEKIHDKMGSVGGAKWDDMPKARKGQAAIEDRILEGVSQIDILMERYKQAVEYMKWYQPAWNQINDDDQYILKAFYADSSYGCNAAYAIADKLHLDHNNVYKRKNRALDQLTTLLYGRF